MYKLTSEEIKFIDNYLINSEVVHLDIRLEIIDHIATAVEHRMNSSGTDFYSTFKEYMIENKQALLKGNKMFPKAALKTTFLFFIKFLIKPCMLLLFFVLLFSFYILFTLYSITVTETRTIIHCVIIAAACLQLSQYRKNNRFSGLEKLSVLLPLFYYINILILGILELSINSELFTTIHIWITAIFLSILPVYILNYYSFKKELRKKFSLN